MAVEKNTENSMAKKKVYVALVSWNYEGTSIRGVYSTPDKAQARLDSLKYGDQKVVVEMTVDADFDFSGYGES